MSFMSKLDSHNETLLMHKIYKGGRPNIYDWIENICEDFYEEEAIEEIISIDEIKTIFYNNLHESFFVTIQNLMFKFLIEKRSSI